MKKPEGPFPDGNAPANRETPALWATAGAARTRRVNAGHREKESVELKPDFRVNIIAAGFQEKSERICLKRLFGDSVRFDSTYIY